MVKNKNFCVDFRFVLYLGGMDLVGVPVSAKGLSGCRIIERSSTKCDESSSNFDLVGGLEKLSLHAADKYLWPKESVLKKMSWKTEWAEVLTQISSIKDNPNNMSRDENTAQLCRSYNKALQSETEIWNRLVKAKDISKDIAEVQRNLDLMDSYVPPSLDSGNRISKAEQQRVTDSPIKPLHESPIRPEERSDIQVRRKSCGREYGSIPHVSLLTALDSGNRVSKAEQQRVTDSPIKPLHESPIWPEERSDIQERRKSCGREYGSIPHVSLLTETTSFKTTKEKLKSLKEEYAAMEMALLKPLSESRRPGPVGDSPLHNCLLLGLTDLFEKVVTRRPDLVNLPYENDLDPWRTPRHDGGEADGEEDGLYTGETALHMAIVQKDLRLVGFLLENGASLSARARGVFFQPRLIRIRALHPTTLQLLEVGALGRATRNDESGAYFGEYPLSFAASVGCVDACKRLLEAWERRAAEEAAATVEAAATSGSAPGGAAVAVAAGRPLPRRRRPCRRGGGSMRARRDSARAARSRG